MAFSLVSQRTGERKTFTIRHLLNFWANEPDDEVFIGEDVYNLSTYQEESGGTGTDTTGALRTFQMQLTEAYHEEIPFARHGIKKPLGLIAFFTNTGERVAMGYTIHPTTKTIYLDTVSSMQGLSVCVF